MSDIAGNISDMMETSGYLIIYIAEIAGMVITGVSLYMLYRASKNDNKESPIGGVVGLVVGGLLMSIPLILWVLYNTLLEP